MKKLITKYTRNINVWEMLHEYRVLLSAGFSDEDAEKMIIAYFFAATSDTDDTLRWIGLALYQWSVGRLSSSTHDEVFFRLVQQSSCLPPQDATDIASLLDSPMPPRKPIRKGFTHRCPWTEGTLLAYRITSHGNRPHSRFYGKYVLLRIVKIKKWPASVIEPTISFSESMYVVLYNWIGDSIPDSNITSGLEITYTRALQPQFPPVILDMLKQALPSNKINGNWLTNNHSVRYGYLTALDWESKKIREEVFTPIGVNSEDLHQFDSCLQEEGIPPLCGVSCFDIVLTNRLEELFPNYLK